MQMRRENLLRGVLAGALLLPLAAGAASYGTATIQLTIENPQMTCPLTINGQAALTYNLGDLLRGKSEEHNPITLQVTCTDGTAKTGITAALVGGGTLQGRDTVWMQVNGTQPADAQAPRLQLKHNGQAVKLTGQPEDWFCEHDNTSASSPNTCLLTPYTQVPDNAPQGALDMTLQLNVVYPQ